LNYRYLSKGVVRDEFSGHCHRRHFRNRQSGGDPSSFLKQVRVSRFGEAEDIAELLASIVSSKAKYMTGTVLRMDGGEVKSN
jgi:NAD(P)-dependent dehydrogenase (short-subunit alcohol dehydrogenase family)